jgi:hypothetical protein
MSESKVVCILGMHRSGTSLVARVLNLIGLDLGPAEHLMGPSAANETGHWESVPISDLNDEILELMGGTWSEPPELPAGWERRPELADLRRRARDLIDRDFGASEVWGFKDPRVSLTAPFWQRIVGGMHYVICLRNPVDVAASLSARKSEPVEFGKGVELWLTYTRAALAATAGQRREFVFYEDLMAKPKPSVKRLARFAGLEAQARNPERKGALAVALSQGLWHHRTRVADVVDAPGLPFHLKSFYLALRQFVPGGEPVEFDTLDLLASYASRASHRLAELEADRAALEPARKRARELDSVLERTLAEFERLSESMTDERRLRRVADAELRAVRFDLKEARADLRQLETAGAKEEARVATPPKPYDRVVADVRSRVEELVPPGATVLVAGKGDDALLELEGVRARHFPAAADGRYLGYHPSGDTAAIAQLEAQRARGADHLVLPATTLWWLQHYGGLRRHLQDRYVLLRRDERCAIFRLSHDDAVPAAPMPTLKRAISAHRIQASREPTILDWSTGLDLAERLPELKVFSPPEADVTLPYLDHTVDIVVVGSIDDARKAEARRVAAGAVIAFDRGRPETAELDQLAADAAWGRDVAVTLLPERGRPFWGETINAVAENAGEGFGGELKVVAAAAELESASEHAASAGVRLRAVEAAEGASLGERARLAAAASDRSVQVFITAPALPLPGWLSSMISLFARDSQAGVVGTRILASDGALEEAGGILKPGHRLRRGAGDPDPDRPEYSFVRPVDFCSPPMLATQRELFDRLAGFDRQRPADEAVVDYSLRAGQVGTRVLYQPDARVVAMDG